MSPLRVMHGRFAKLSVFDSMILVVPDLQEYSGIISEAKELNIEVYAYDCSKIIEKPIRFRQQRWDIEDDSGNDTLVGAHIAMATEKKRWKHIALIDVANLLVEPSSVVKSLDLLIGQSYDFCFSSERQIGASWTLMTTDFLRGMFKSHEELMYVRGGLAWAMRKPLYPFKSGLYTCPRIRPSMFVDLRLNSKRSLKMYRSVNFPEFDSPDFSYEKWLSQSNWEKYYTDYGPKIIYIEPSSMCEAACFGCPHPLIEQTGQNMSLENYTKLMQDLNEVDDVRIHFSGMGEPMHNPKIAEFAGMTEKVSSMLVTSLQKPFPDGFPYHALDQIRISVDALEAQSFDVLRPGNNWQNIENFLLFAARCKQISPDRFPEIGVSFVRHGKNESETQNFIKYWKKVVEPIYRQNFFKWPFDCKPENVQWFQILGESSYINFRERSSKVDFVPVKRRLCKFATLSLTIKADGTVCSCPWDINKQNMLGSLKDESVKTIWSLNSEQFKKEHFDFKTNGLCTKCSEWYNTR